MHLECTLFDIFWSKPARHSILVHFDTWWKEKKPTQKIISNRLEYTLNYFKGFTIDLAGIFNQVWLEYRQYKNDSRYLKISLVLKLPPFFCLPYSIREKGGNFKARKIFNYPELVLYCLYSSFGLLCLWKKLHTI